MSMSNVVSTLLSFDRKCTRCGACVPKCEVLEEGTGECLGQVARDFMDAAGFPKGKPIAVNNPNVCKSFAEKVGANTRGIMKLYYSSLKCSICGYCTASCPEGLDARNLFTALRELYVHAGLSNGTGFESLQMDRQWNLFSAYRAIYGIYYNDLPQLGQTTDPGYETLFFPGCTLVSYAPELTRDIYEKICEVDGYCLICEECCGSPMVSAGFQDRAKELRRVLMQKAVDLGVKKVICVCPGCMEALESVPETAGMLEFVSLPQFLLDAGMKVSPERCADYGTLTVFDSCHDRGGRFGEPLRQLLSDCPTSEMQHRGKQTLCCGAGGSCSMADPDVAARKTQAIYDECAESGGDTVVTCCPTCAYTLYNHAATHPSPDMPYQASYLDFLFDHPYDWQQIFDSLGGMWTGDYGPWAAQELSHGLNEDLPPRDYC